MSSAQLPNHGDLIVLGEDYSFDVKEGVHQIHCIVFGCEEELVVAPVACDARHVLYLALPCLSVQLFSIVS